MSNREKWYFEQCAPSLLLEASVCKRIICNGEGHVRGLGKNLLSKIVSIFFHRTTARAHGDLEQLLFVSSCIMWNINFLHSVRHKRAPPDNFHYHDNVEITTQIGWTHTHKIKIDIGETGFQ